MGNTNKGPNRTPKVLLSSGSTFKIFKTNYDLTLLMNQLTFQSFYKHSLIVWKEILGHDNLLSRKSISSWP